MPLPLAYGLIDGHHSGMESLRGQLLVATPVIQTGVFYRGVVYVLDHDTDGAVGVVVNHRLAADVSEILPQWMNTNDSLLSAPSSSPVCESLFGGGPVATNFALAVGVAAATDSPTGWTRVCGHIGVIDLEGPSPEPHEFRGIKVFAGYSGWGPGQLENEIDEGSWVVASARDEDLLARDPEHLWKRVLLRQSSDVRFLATFPADPSLN